MPRSIANRRAEERSDIPRFINGRIRLEAADGRSDDFLLTDISLSGICFETPDRLDWVAPQTVFNTATIQIANVTLNGGVRVLHVARVDGPGYACGAQFFPRGEEDRNQLVELLTKLEALPQR